MCAGPTWQKGTHVVKLELFDLFWVLLHYIHLVWASLLAKWNKAPRRVFKLLFQTTSMPLEIQPASPAYSGDLFSKGAKGSPSSIQHHIKHMCHWHYKQINKWILQMYDSPYKLPIIQKGPAGRRHDSLQSEWFSAKSKFWVGLQIGPVVSVVATHMFTTRRSVKSNSTFWRSHRRYKARSVGSTGPGDAWCRYSRTVVCDKDWKGSLQVIYVIIIP